MATETKEINGSMVKIPWGALVTFISWLVAVVIGYSALETKDHAEKTFVRKDVFEQIANKNTQDMTEIKDILKSINEKLDRKQDKKGIDR